MVFGVSDFHKCPARYTTKHTLYHSNKLVYDRMLMNKEFNNKYSDSNTIIFMGKKPLFSLMKWRDRSYNLILVVEKLFSSEPCLKVPRFPTSCSLVLVKFGQSLDAITYYSSLYPWGMI